MNDDPLVILATTTDPRVAVWAVNELAAAGFSEPEKIARDFGWHVEGEVTR